MVICRGIILFCLLIHFPQNSRFTFLLTVLFNNLTTFFEETLPLKWLKARNKVFVFYLRKFSLIKNIWYKYTLSVKKKSAKSD